MILQLGGSTTEDINHWIQFYSVFVLMKPNNKMSWTSATLSEVFATVQAICRHYLSYKVSSEDPCAEGNPYSIASRAIARSNCHKLARLIEEVIFTLIKL